MTTIKEWITLPAMSGSRHENLMAMQMQSFDRDDSQQVERHTFREGDRGIRVAPHIGFLEFLEASRIPGTKRVHFSNGGIGNRRLVRPPGVDESHDIDVYVAEPGREEQPPPKPEGVSEDALDIRQDCKLSSSDVESAVFESTDAGGQDGDSERGGEHNHERSIVVVSPTPSSRHHTISVDCATSQQYSRNGSLGHQVDQNSVA
jgi:hypothetical protein